MAKYDVTYACGHTETVNLYGKTSERERKIEWMENNCVCPACYKADRQAKAAETAAAYDLPALVGTEKQVAWAETLRAEIFKEVADLEKKAGKPAAEADGKFAEFFVWLKGQTEARFWIDNRALSLHFLGRKWNKGELK
jgi:hypothetical protein|nr:MAG TPA: hypothetical protein [Caudoviricetes sp.]